ncbi:hypothetical protein L1049_013974 [Liquidambar formosana]|uniref:Beta-1,3-N-Acetylglucosaminyltransferase family protein n=1 Tax=Liquidambar formosana TaxID=63359 RepID=A0AAP0WX98_LIQFO
MAAILQSLLVIVLLSLIGQGMCQNCSTGDLLVQQNQTGTNVQSKPEFKVTVLNECPCLQANVKLGCDGFQTVEPIDPLALAKSGNGCLLINGSSMGPFSQVSFTYAWDTQFPFTPISSDINCN